MTPTTATPQPVRLRRRLHPQHQCLQPRRSNRPQHHNHPNNLNLWPIFPRNLLNCNPPKEPHLLPQQGAHRLPSQLIQTNVVRCRGHTAAHTAVGLNLPRHIQSTAHSTHNRTAGLPIESIPLLAFLRHSWSSYWLRYIAHGHEPHIVRTKHVNEAVFATELLGMLRARRIDLDQAAAAYCWEEKLTLAKRPALTQLVKELVIYMQELQDQYNQSNNTPADKHSEEKQQHREDTSKQNNPVQNTTTSNAPDTGHVDNHAAHRISDLEAKLAAALGEADALRAAASHTAQPTTPRRNTGAATRSPRTPPPNVTPGQALSTDNTPTSTTRGTKRSYSPTAHTGLPIKDNSQEQVHMKQSTLYSCAPAVKETPVCLCSCTPCEGIHAQVTSQGGPAGAQPYIYIYTYTYTYTYIYMNTSAHIELYCSVLM